MTDSTDNRSKKDQKVNGPAIAAAIMKRLPADSRQRIMQGIEASAPEVAAKVETNLYHFEEITTLSATGMSEVLREAKHSDIITALHGASPATRTTVLRLMSDQNRALIANDLKDYGANPQQIADAQRRLMKLIDELRSQGKIETDRSKTRYA